MRGVAIYAYKPGSQSARAFGALLQSPVLRHEGSRYRPAGKTIINWGSGNAQAEPLRAAARVVNSPEAVASVANKLSFFQAMDVAEQQLSPAPRVVPWTNDQLEARRWTAEGHTVVARTVLSGHSGQGIVICGPGDVDFPDARLYTRYVKKSAEFRVHVFDGEVIDVQRKIRDPNRGEPLDWKVRSHANGFIYVRNEIVVPEDVREQARRAMGRSGLVFGAVDVIFNDREQAAYVLEINTAPGLTGQTVETYANAFRRYLDAA